MKIKSVSGVTCYGKNLSKMVKFYGTLGLETKKIDATHATLYSNWFWMDFLVIAKNERVEFTKGADLTNKDAGLFPYLSVDTVDEFHKGLVSKGLKPSTSPRISLGVTASSSFAIPMVTIWLSSRENRLALMWGRALSLARANVNFLCQM